MEPHLGWSCSIFSSNALKLNPQKRNREEIQFGSFGYQKWSSWYQVPRHLPVISFNGSTGVEAKLTQILGKDQGPDAESNMMQQRQKRIKHEFVGVFKHVCFRSQCKDG